MNQVEIAPFPFSMPKPPGMAGNKRASKSAPKSGTEASSIVVPQAVASSIIPASEPARAPALIVEPPPAPEAGPVIIEGATPGCYSMAMSNAEYHALADSVSTSGLKKILRSPADFMALRDAPDEEESDDIGSAFHCAVLEPERFKQDYRAYGANRRLKAFSDFKKENPGKIILTDYELTTVARMCDSLKRFDEYPIWAALRRAQRELSVFWTDEETGVKCRVRFDALNAPFASWDLKSTTDARPEYFINQAIRLDYDLQAAMYREAARRYLGKDIPFIFVAVETKGAYGVWPHSASQEMIENGQKKMRRALALYKKCSDENHWPGYTNTMTELKWPRYARLAD